MRRTYSSLDACGHNSKSSPIRYFDPNNDVYDQSESDCAPEIHATSWSSLEGLLIWMLPTRKRGNVDGRLVIPLPLCWQESNKNTYLHSGGGIQKCCTKSSRFLRIKFPPLRSGIPPPFHVFLFRSLLWGGVVKAQDPSPVVLKGGNLPRHEFY